MEQDKVHGQGVCKYILTLRVVILLTGTTNIPQHNGAHCQPHNPILGQ